MNIRFADQPLEIGQPSIFLAGPTPRSPDVSSWRPQALGLLEELGFTGTVLVPERRDWSVKFNYLDQVEWEYAGLESCSVIAFWVSIAVRKWFTRTLDEMHSSAETGAAGRRRLRYDDRRSFRTTFSHPDRLPGKSVGLRRLAESVRLCSRFCRSTHHT